jgi:hypothetical protein
MLNAGMVNAGGFYYLSAAKRVIFRVFTPKVDSKKSVKYILSSQLTKIGRIRLTGARRRLPTFLSRNQ